MFTDQELIDAIRNHPLVGLHTCSVVDECFDNEELVEWFANDNAFEVRYENEPPRRVASLAIAIKSAVDYHNTYHGMRDENLNLDY